MFIFCRLSTNFECSDGKQVRLEYIYNSCTYKFKDKFSKDVCSKAVQRLFGVEPSTIYERGQRKTVYKHLKEIINDSEASGDSTLSIPDHCHAYDYENKLHIKCPLDNVTNGMQNYCTMTFEEGMVSLQYRTYSTSFTFEQAINQTCIFGLIFLVHRLKWCRGLESENFNRDQEYMKETKASIIEKEKITNITRSSSCSFLLNMLSNQDLCEDCKSLMKPKKQRCPLKEIHPQNQNTKKRRKENDKNEQTKIDKPTNAIKSTIEIVDQPERDNVIQVGEDDHKDLEKILNIVMSLGVPENFRYLLEAQLKNCQNMDARRRRWDPKVISICLSIYIRSPQAFEDIKSSGMLVLPSKRLLQYYKNSVTQTPGFSRDNFQWMKKEAEKQKISEFGKHGGVLIDEMTIQDDLVIAKEGENWSLVGFVDMDPINDNIEVICSKEVKLRLATHVLQFVFHGLTGFRWPVCYFGTETATAHQLYTLFWKCVDILDNYGFVCDYVMMDGASTNRSFTHMLFKGDPRDDNFRFRDIYFHEHVLCVIQDIMHVFKKIRNNIESSRKSNQSQNGRYLLLNGKDIVWNHWQDCYEYNTKFGIRTHRKLSEEHIKLSPTSKMRNQLAMEVLNKDMLYLMKGYQSSLNNPEELASSVDLLENTSVLVDIFCNTNQPICSLTDSRFASLREILKFFNSWEEQVSKHKDGNVGKHLITRETREDINSSISGFISLCHLMIGKGNTINPGFINSNLIENLFGQQRGVRNGLNSNPTLKQYGPSNTAIVLSQCTVSKKCNSGVSANYFKATTPCPLNDGRNKKLKHERGIRL